MGYSVSLYLDDEKTWTLFKDACESEKKRPNAVLRSFIEHYLEESYALEPVEQRIARGMLQAKKIASGKIKAKKAEDLLKEMNSNKGI